MLIYTIYSGRFPHFEGDISCVLYYANDDIAFYCIILRELGKVKYRAAAALEMLQPASGVFCGEG